MFRKSSTITKCMSMPMVATLCAWERPVPVYMWHINSSHHRKMTNRMEWSKWASNRIELYRIKSKLPQMDIGFTWYMRHIRFTVVITRTYIIYDCEIGAAGGGGGEVLRYYVLVQLRYVCDYFQHYVYVNVIVSSIRILCLLLLVVVDWSGFYSGLSYWLW